MSPVAELLDRMFYSFGDRLPWLVFADWLEDRGHTLDAVRVRECAWDEIHPYWFLSVDFWYEADAWCDVVADIGKVEERELVIHTVPWREVVTNPGFFFDGKLTDRGLTALATTHAPNLRWLDLGWADLTDVGAGVLARATGFPSLKFVLFPRMALSAGTRAAFLHKGVHVLSEDLPCPGGWPCCCPDCPGFGNEEGYSSDQAADDWLLAPDRPDRDARPRHPGWSRHRWWGGYQVGQLRKRKRLARSNPDV